MKGFTFLVAAAFAVHAVLAASLPRMVLTTPGDSIPKSDPCRAGGVVYEVQAWLDGLNGESVPPKFWEELTRHSDAARTYALRVHQLAVQKFADVKDSLHQFDTYIGATVDATAQFRKALEDGVGGVKRFEEDLPGLLQVVMDGLEMEFPPPENAPGHEERRNMVRIVLSRTGEAVISMGAAHGIDEKILRDHVGFVSTQVEFLAVVTGDLAEQHPELVDVLAFTVATLLIPESWFLRPFLSMMGFAPSGPVKGSSAAWMQRRFFGAAVSQGSWFAHLQRASMKQARGIFSGILGIILGVLESIRIMLGW
ncbi:hypothetical protein BXZ70DRAFT_920079 [Cristinia sonorae]|uniref:Uncharacterized protein n=1 Tax=Cristinia sonorae TaxID=1940300 RepID=A0A8K0UW78_9AGAR|nr:hypothetical protein BXZ70DRAFT_920079 [Cristinia sonorae]